MNYLSKDTNIQNNPLNINKVSNEQLSCNYTNNYYGDQLCLVKRSCNYADNYYGDQICLTNNDTARLP